MSSGFEAPLGHLPGEAIRGFKKENPGQFLAEPGSVVTFPKPERRSTSMMELTILMKVVIGLIAITVLVKIRFRMKP